MTLFNAQNRSTLSTLQPNALITLPFLISTISAVLASTMTSPQHNAIHRATVAIAPFVITMVMPSIGACNPTTQKGWLSDFGQQPRISSLRMKNKTVWKSIHYHVMLLQMSMMQLFGMVSTQLPSFPTQILIPHIAHSTQLILFRLPLLLHIPVLQLQILRTITHSNKNQL